MRQMTTVLLFIELLPKKYACDSKILQNFCAKTGSMKHYKNQVIQGGSLWWLKGAGKELGVTSITQALLRERQAYERQLFVYYMIVQFLY